jgi:hypothetical protein
VGRPIWGTQTLEYLEGGDKSCNGDAFDKATMILSTRQRRSEGPVAIVHHYRSRSSIFTGSRTSPIVQLTGPPA